MSFVVLVVTLAEMGVTENAALWVALRSVAGVASACIFAFAATTRSRLRHHAHHLIGWAHGGVGVASPFPACSGSPYTPSSRGEGRRGLLGS